MWVYLRVAGLRELHSEWIDGLDVNEPRQELQFDEVPVVPSRQTPRSGTRSVIGRNPRWNDELEAWVYETASR